MDFCLDLGLKTGRRLFLEGEEKGERVLLPSSHVEEKKQS